jgi:hypothetical protein
LELNLPVPAQRKTHEISIFQGTDHNDYDITVSLMDSNQCSIDPAVSIFRAVTDFFATLVFSVPSTKILTHNSSGVGTTAVYGERFTKRQILFL